METQHTKPTFTLLRLVNTDKFEYELYDILDGKIYLSSSGLRRFHFHRPDYISHGPCLTTAHEQGKVDIDFAPCVKCHKWIKPAKPWITR